MDFFDVIAKRQSIRAYRPQAIDDETITRLLEAIRTAPTAGNLQAYQVYLVRTPDKIKALTKASMDQECIAEARAVMVFCTDAPRSVSKYGDRGRNLYCIQDATIAATIAHLAATALGLGSVLVGAFKEEDVAAAIGAPPHQRPITMLPLGYPAEQPARTERRPLSDLVVRV
jgi:nitroreductase